MVLAGVGVRLLDRLGAPRILDRLASLGGKATTFSCVLVNAVHEDCWRMCYEHDYSHVANAETLDLSLPIKPCSMLESGVVIHSPIASDDTQPLVGAFAIPSPTTSDDTQNPIPAPSSTFLRTVIRIRLFEPLQSALSRSTTCLHSHWGMVSLTGM